MRIERGLSYSEKLVSLTAALGLGITALTACNTGGSAEKEVVTVTANASPVPGQTTAAPTGRGMPSKTRLPESFHPIIGRIAGTQNARGEAEGTNVYLSPYPGGEQPVDIYPEGRTVPVLCATDDGTRSVPLRLQSPHLNMDSSNRWVLQVTGVDQSDRWLLDVYVDTAGVAIPDCPPALK